MTATPAVFIAIIQLLNTCTQLINQQHHPIQQITFKCTCEIMFQRINHIAEMLNNKDSILYINWIYFPNNIKNQTDFLNPLFYFQFNDWNKKMDTKITQKN